MLSYLFNVWLLDVVRGLHVLINLNELFVKSRFFSLVHSLTELEQGAKTLSHPNSLFFFAGNSSGLSGVRIIPLYKGDKRLGDPKGDIKKFIHHGVRIEVSEFSCHQLTSASILCVACR